ncbi:MAG: LON peptidase substrate-binding domain-containing protein, partial [Phocaeicola sp.]
MARRGNKEDFIINAETDEIGMLAEIETDMENLPIVEFDKEIPVLPLRNMVMFPQVVMPVTVGRKATQKLVNAAYKNEQPIAVVCQLQGETDEPGYSDLHHIGVIAKVLRIFEMPGGNSTVILQSNGPKVELQSIVRTSPYLQGIVTPLEEEKEETNNDEFKALIDTCKELTTKFIETSDKLSPDTVFAIRNIENSEILVSFVCTNFPFSVEEKIAMLKLDHLQERMFLLIQSLNREIKLASIKQNIQIRTREEIDRQQKEYFLHQQIKNIQDELGSGQDDEIDELREKGEKKKWSKEVAALFEKELAKLERTNTQSPDYNVQLTYLQTIVTLPWNVYTNDNLNITHAEKRLNKDHYGLEKVKERILEHLAVLKLKGDMKSPIICLYGPPG